PCCSCWRVGCVPHGLRRWNRRRPGPRPRGRSNRSARPRSATPPPSRLPAASIRPWRCPTPTGPGRSPCGTPGAPARISRRARWPRVARCCIPERPWPEPIRAGDHPVVHVGGRGHVLWWSGTQSGGSYPWPASYPGAAGSFGPIGVSDDTRKPARTLEADKFDVVLLPEPARLDARAHPDLSWLKLPFFAGQSRTYENPPLVDRFGGGRPPRQPARRADWDAIASWPLWSGLPVVDGPV